MVIVLKNKLVTLKRNTFSSYSYQFYYSIWDKTCLIGLGTLLINQLLYYLYITHTQRSTKKFSAYLTFQKWSNIRIIILFYTLLMEVRIFQHPVPPLCVCWEEWFICQILWSAFCYYWETGREKRKERTRKKEWLKGGWGRESKRESFFMLAQVMNSTF